MKEKRHKLRRILLEISACITIAISVAQNLVPYSYFSAEIGRIFAGYIIFASISSIIEGVIATDCEKKKYNITENVIEIDEMIEKHPGCFLTNYFFYDKDLSHKKGTTNYTALKVEVNSEIFRTLVDKVAVRVNNIEEQIMKSRQFTNKNDINNVAEVEFEMQPDIQKTKVFKRNGI